MPAHPKVPRLITLEPPPDEHWTLHHVLLNRIEQETRAKDAAIGNRPPLEVYQAFDIVDNGETQFSAAQLEVIQDILAEYHHSTTWEIERSRLEALLHRIATILEDQSKTRTSYPSVGEEA